MSELQPGMLALIINARNPENIGAMVDVIRFVNKGDPIPEISETQLATNTGWLVSGDIKNIGGCVGFGISRPCDLLPIKPEDDIIHEEDLAELEVR